MDCYAIVLNYNQRLLTQNLVLSLISSSVFTKIIIIDNCSPQNDFDCFSFSDSNVECYKNNVNSGYGSGMNFGFSKIPLGRTDSVVFFFNPDVRVSKETICVIAAFLANHPTIALASAQRQNGDGSPQVQFWKASSVAKTLFSSSLCYDIFQKFSKPKFYHNGEYIIVGEIPGSFFGIKQSVFSQVGGFDENVFLYYEEAILSRKLSNLGYQEALLLQCSYVHDHPVSKNVSFSAEKYKVKTMIQSKTYFYLHYLKPPLLLALLGDVFFSFQKFRLLCFAFLSSVFHKKRHT